MTAKNQSIVEGQVVRVAASYTPIVARTKIHTRPAVMDDLPFIDRMQKKHSRELGFLPTAAIEGKIELGQVLVAEANGGRVSSPAGREGADTAAGDSRPPEAVGYLIAADRYQKRDEIGYVTQVNVLPEYRRFLIAGQLLQAQFDRSAYGCRLYCCWCAQDLAANGFWEAMGFTAIAFRTGSMSKGKKGTPRVHIFWQKRIRANDTTTPWWYPSTTGGGEMRADRLVFPILPGVSWRDVGPIMLAGEQGLEVRSQMSENAGRKPRAKKAPANVGPKLVPRGPRVKGGLWFEEDLIVVEPEKPALPVKTQKPKEKIDPRLLAMARELRDQWTERAGQIVTETAGKHDVKRIAKAGAVDTLRLEQPVETRRIDRAA